MNYKIQHTKKHIEQGFWHFKLVANCNSEKAEKSFKKFCGDGISIYYPITCDREDRYNKEEIIWKMEGWIGC